MGSGTINIDVAGNSVETVANFIDANMPQGSAASCVDQCAVDIATYILSW